MPHVYTGTSGFAYPTWKPGFYPADVPAKRFLQHYATRLTSTEINYTYRRLPAKKSLEEWVAATPSGFLFSLKAHMKLTHILRLRDCESFLAVFLDAIDPLRVVGRLGPVLFGLPPSMKADVELLRTFLAQLPSDQRFAFEFRHPSWFQDPVYNALAERGICLCLAESERLTVPEVLTAPFVYFRLRLPEYSPEELSATADRIRGLNAEGRDVFLYFKHEDSPAGALYAEQILRMLEEPETGQSRTVVAL
jgi:uncharacterized protein YecE (DUF72 family)